MQLKFAYLNGIYQYSIYGRFVNLRILIHQISLMVLAFHVINRSFQIFDGTESTRNHTEQNNNFKFITSII